MSARLVAISAAVCAGLVLAAAWLFAWPLEKAIVLAPVIVLAVGAAAGVAVLWTRIALDHLRRSRHPRRIVAIGVGVVVLVVALTLLGVELPRE